MSVFTFLPRLTFTSINDLQRTPTDALFLRFGPEPFEENCRYLGTREARGTTPNEVGQTVIAFSFTQIVLDFYNTAGSIPTQSKPSEMPLLSLSTTIWPPGRVFGASHVAVAKVLQHRRRCHFYFFPLPAVPFRVRLDPGGGSTTSGNPGSSSSGGSPGGGSGGGGSSGGSSSSGGGGSGGTFTAVVRAAAARLSATTCAEDRRFFLDPAASTGRPRCMTPKCRRVAFMRAFGLFICWHIRRASSNRRWAHSGPCAENLLTQLRSAPKSSSL